LHEVGTVIKGSKVLIMGMAYKENVADTRESPVIGIVGGLSELFMDARRWCEGQASFYVPWRIN
jgi:UDP-N-acetyl-D-mannosaminuronate dehydrogenase